MAKQRMPLQASPRFVEKLKELQIKIMKTGKQRSLRDLTDDLINSKAFEEVEKKLSSGSINMDINIKLDRRIMQ